MYGFKCVDGKLIEILKYTYKYATNEEKNTYL